MSQPVAEPVNILPMDRYNQELIKYLHPPDWINPEPIDRYNLVVIGGGTAGLVTAAGAALLGAKVALVEKHLLGGDCTNVGCVPSKAMIRSARVVAEIQQAQQFGVTTAEVNVDFVAVMERLRRIRATISPHDSAQRFQQEFGVDVFFGEARFASANTIAVADKTLCFRRAAIATGSRPTQLPIEGLAAAGYLTNETVFSLTERPARLAVIGGGYIGCELAQTFQRLGSTVVLLQKGDRLLSREDTDAAQVLQETFVQEGMQLVLAATIQRIERQNAEKIIHYEVNGQSHSVTVDEILVGTGRSPNVENLGLEAAGVKSDQKQGVLVNDYLQTSNPHVYAVGDVCMDWKFTHAADAAARIVVQNALFSGLGLGRKKLSSLTMPWCTYTDPEVAHVGLYPEQAERQGIAVETFSVSLDSVDRAIVDGETTGFIKIYAKKGSDRILGATIVARHAGEMISQITLAMVNHLGLSALSQTIHPYPTQAQMIRQAADVYSLQRLQAFKKLATLWLNWRR
jgi:dihydrolipoamide dehydrogenase